MSKEKELLKLLGFKEDVLSTLEAEETILGDIATKYKEDQKELFKASADIFEPLKKGATEEGKIVATKKFKKLISDNFGLGLSHNDLKEIEIDTLLDQGKALIDDSRKEDVVSKDEKIIELTNALNTSKEESVAAIDLIKSEYAQKETTNKLNKALLLIAEKNEYVGLGVTEALDYFKLKSGQNYNLKFDKEGTLKVFDKKDYPAKKQDDSGFLSLEELVNTTLDPFIKKNNGNGDKAKPEPAGAGDKYISPRTKEMLKQLA